jgi:5-methylcytosine-specific restriction endonuclease McrA
MREFAKHFYKSKAWRECRAAYIIKVHGLCERCSAGGKIVHHKIYLNESNIDDPYVTLSHDNLELLCHDCHNREHFAGKVAIASGLSFDEDGNIISSRQGPPGF